MSAQLEALRFSVARSAPVVQRLMEPVIQALERGDLWDRRDPKAPSSGMFVLDRALEDLATELTRGRP